MNIKDLLRLDVIYGKKGVTVLYYAALIVASLDFLYNVLSGLVNMFSGNVGNGLWGFITAPVLLAFYVIVIRVVCEVLNTYFDKKA